MDKRKTNETEGDIGTPGSELTREQVMAQRAEKKKLKEARKNKSAVTTAATSEDSATPPEKKPQGQSGKNKKSTTDLDASNSKDNSAQRKQKEIQSTETPKSASAQKLQQKPHASTTPPITQASTTSNLGKESTTKPLAKDVSPTPAIDSSPDTTLPATPGMKAEHLERGGTCTKTAANEVHSTIQSLFQVKRSHEVKVDHKFRLHPLFHSLGVKLRNNVVRGTNKRCITLLNTIKEYVRYYQTPSGMSFKHGLATDLQINLDVLRVKCPFAIGMNNAVEFLNAFLYKMEQDEGDVHQQKEEINEVIDQYIEEKIEKAVEAIVEYGIEKVCTGDIIMIYSITEAVLSLLEKAAEDGKIFELIIIQTPETMFDIYTLLKKLNKPIKNQCVNISSVNFSNAIYRMRHCTKLLIGGHGLFTTGGVMAQSGSGKLALLAATFNKPALFLCETYKFCDRSPLDFFTLDEYIHEQSITEDGLFEPKIKYDVTPANLVTVVITDIDMLPSTSVPVVLRVQEGRAPRTTESSVDSSP